MLAMTSALRRLGTFNVGTFSALAALVLIAAMFAAGAAGASPNLHVATHDLSADSRTHYHNGVFGQAAEEWCTSTSTYTPSHHIRTQIVRNTDGWSNTISSRYKKYKDCTARQMTSTVWCTTQRVDGVSKMCITPRPQAGSGSPCRHRRLDVRGVYHPHTGILRITCVNKD